MTNPVHDKMI